MRRGLLGVVAILGILASRPAIAPVSSVGEIPLSGADVSSILQAAAQALSDSTLAAAVVDRTGQLLGVYARPGATLAIQNVAVSLARTTGFFSNDQAPLSSRTVRFISGIHFPAGIKNTGNAALYGVENINRGCMLGSEADAIFNAGISIPRSRSLQATALSPLTCQPSNTTGCGIGITTGKDDLRDADNGAESAINPGGISLYRNRRLVGGVGVAGVSYDRAQYAALIAAAGNGVGITAAIDFPNLLPTPGAIYIDGIRLPFYGSCGTNIPCIQQAAQTRPAGSSAGSVSSGSFTFLPRSGQTAPEGYLIGPRNSPRPGGGLTSADAQQVVNQAVAQANITRAQVRLPFGDTATFIIAVTDKNGDIVAEYRMRDALFDAVDVVPSKARNAYYFSTREGYDVLKSYVDARKYDSYSWEPAPPAGQGWALTSRTISFGGQPLFPPGIDLEKTPTPGPWFDLFLYDTANPCTEGPGPSRGGNRTFINQNGITWFPGSAPLYRNGQLVGGVGVSGDGVEQNDLVTSAAAVGFEPPLELRVDQSVIRTGKGEEVRLPYLKFPRNPTQR